MPKSTLITAVLICFGISALTAQADSLQLEIQKRNKELALSFYEDLWGSNNTDLYSKYMADTYVAHDIGDRKGLTEDAVQQKEIADFFWKNGDMKFTMDYQIAEGDLFATRWFWDYEPKTLFGKVMLGDNQIPIINVFRFQDGKIVELWNHRHDIDTGMTLRFKIQGFLLGLLVALIPTIIAFRLRRKLRRATA